MSLETLTEISRFYGKNPEFVLAGGGNTSWKDEETLYVKSSGMSLADVSPDSFVKMNRRVLARIWEKQYPPSGDERESAVLADMMAARESGEEKKRPSVEALLHDLLPFAFVVHLHPALVNGLTCSRQGETAMWEIFGNDAIWIPSTNPGYILSKTVKTAMDAYSAVNGKAPAIIFLQNHGVFAGGNNVKGVNAQYSEIMHRIDARIKRRPDFAGENHHAANAGDRIREIMQTLTELAGSAVFLQGSFQGSFQGGEIARLVKDRTSFAPVSSAFTPDHIVYAGSDPLFVETKETLRDAWKDHVQKTGLKPKIVAVQGMGIFGAAQTEKAACLALELFRDAIKVSVYTESFGGPLFMTREQIDFINNWEVERFRSQVSV
jgi:rhamnose utilization protein RhaD (predicted bifunctional aldolase and dehydrogenase)